MPSLQRSFVGILLPALCAFAQAPTPSLTVDAFANRHPISPEIYGIVNYNLDPAFAEQIKLPNTRWGGDGTTRYNWQVDSSNAGFDWYFISGSGVSKPIPSAGPDAMIKTFKPAGTHPLITIPIIPYINSSAAYACSFPVSVYGAQQSTDPYLHPNNDSCGNSISATGQQLTDTTISSNNRNNSPQFQQNWINHFVMDFGTAAKGGVTYYQLDNEPGGWNNTHRDVEPNVVPYDTIFSLGSEYAVMIKTTDPSASVLGPSDYTLGGWIGTAADMQEHGGLYAGQWYLKEMQAAQKIHRLRLLDYFDEHVYGGSTSDDNYELQSTRSLWDPSYNSGTFVEQYYFGNMQLIPRFKGWINQYYPGTKLAFSEYSWGQHNTLVGALAEADILGIFGWQQVDFANMWDTPAPTDPAAYAFRLYRNYDGNGGMFGDISIGAVSFDQTQLSVYAAQRSSDHALTFIVINKTASAITSSVDVHHFLPEGTAHLFTYSAANLQAIVPGPDMTLSDGALTAAFPALSATIIVIPQSTEPLPRIGWKATASSSALLPLNTFTQKPASAFDGNSISRWSSGQAQTAGQWFQVDLGASQAFSKITMDSGAATTNYSHQFQILTSLDGVTWTTQLARGVGSSALVTANFPETTARYLKIVNTESVPVVWWSIAELNIYP